MVLRFALVHPIQPVPVIRLLFRQRRGHKRAFIVLFMERPRQVLSDQINLAGADEYVMAGPLLENIQGGQRVSAGVEGCVNHAIEAARTNRLLQVLFAAPVAIDALHARWKPASRDSAIEDRNRMSALAQKLDDGQTKITRSADDQDLDRTLLGTLDESSIIDGLRYKDLAQPRQRHRPTSINDLRIRSHTEA